MQGSPDFTASAAPPAASSASPQQLPDEDVNDLIPQQPSLPPFLSDPLTRNINAAPHPPHDASFAHRRIVPNSIYNRVVVVYASLVLICSYICMYSSVGVICSYICMYNSVVVIVTMHTHLAAAIPTLCQ